jgi:hypothetical protein
MDAQFVACMKEKGGKAAPAACFSLLLLSGQLLAFAGEAAAATATAKAPNQTAFIISCVQQQPQIIAAPCEAA